MGNEYTANELNEFQIIADDLILWMFTRPDDKHPILQAIKRAFDFGRDSQNK